MQKLYCYVDETGQDTQGDFFLVSVVIVGQERDTLLAILEQIEKTSGKGNVKWADSRDDARLAYINAVLNQPVFKGKLAYAVYRNTTEYLAQTVLTTARAIRVMAQSDYKATILVDGLPKTQTQFFGKELRRQHIRTKKVRGVRKDETDALIRLADALCGLLRGVLLRKKQLYARLSATKEEEGYIKDLREA